MCIFSDLLGAERRFWSLFGAKFSQLLSQVFSRFCTLGRGGTGLHWAARCLEFISYIVHIWLPISLSLGAGDGSGAADA